MAQITFNEPEPRLGGKIRSLPWLFILVVIAIGGIGGGALYSAANASFLPWAKPHLIRFGLSLVIMLAFAFVDIRVWFRLAYPAYALMLALLAGVEVAGKVGAFGAQRWADSRPPPEVRELVDQAVLEAECLGAPVGGSVRGSLCRRWRRGRGRTGGLMWLRSRRRRAADASTPPL